MVSEASQQMKAWQLILKKERIFISILPFICLLSSLQPTSLLFASYKRKSHANGEMMAHTGLGIMLADKTEWFTIWPLIQGRHNHIVLGDGSTSHVQGRRRRRAERRENWWPHSIPCWREWWESIVALPHHRQLSSDLQGGAAFLFMQ